MVWEVDTMGKDSTPDPPTAAPEHRFAWSIHHPRWRHPAVQAHELTLGERAADKMRNGMGSWWFVFVALCFLATWMLINRNDGWDPYPFILLNLVLSCVAAMQGAILLIAARRSDQISSELAHHDYEVNVESESLSRGIEEAQEHLKARLIAIQDQLTAIQAQLEQRPGATSPQQG